MIVDNFASLLINNLEVKHDYKFSQTGNFFLELDALWHSKADLLAIVTDNPRTVYIVPLQPALAFERPRETVKGGSLTLAETSNGTGKERD